MFKSQFEIEGQRIGEKSPVFVIAEIGVNHNGDAALAKKMIDAAAGAGANCIKFQTFRAEEFMADREMRYEYEENGKKISEKMFDMFKRLELPLERYAELFDYARKNKVVPLTSVADKESAEMMMHLGISALKLASEDLINLPLLEFVSKSRLPLIVSTGMADLEEVEDSLQIFVKAEVEEIVFLNCVSLYPTPDHQAQLRRMLGLAEKTRAPVGYSDHTLGKEACLASVALGAKVIEKHFTLDRSLPGPDQSLSMEPHEFKKMIQSIRRVESMLGDREVKPAANEKESRLRFRRSIVAARDLQAAHILTREDFHLKRPGHGLKAREIPNLIGKQLKENISRDQIIGWSSLVG